MTTPDPRSPARNARTARYGRYRATYRGRIITVTGPQRIFPSGLPYYRMADPTNTFVPAAHLELISARERLTVLLRRLHPSRMLRPSARR